MDYLTVVIAAAGCWAFGAAYYMALAKPWVAAVGIETDENGKPKGESPVPYIVSFVCMIVVAGMMRYMFEMANIVEVTKGAIAGLGVGAFFISPWIFINNAYGMRPVKLSLIDAGYATIGAGIIGAILTAL